MAPLSVTIDSVDTRQLLQDQAQCLAIDLVSKYLKCTLKSDKLASKFEEKINMPPVTIDSIEITNKENLTIDDILKKQKSTSFLNEGSSLKSSIIPVMIYKYIKENTTEKVAEKFAKKSNFSYSEAYDNLSKKEQKLSLDRICRKFLKSDESDTTDTKHTKEKSNKRTIDGTDSDGEDGSESPKPKKKRKEDSDKAKAEPSDAQSDSTKEVELPKAPKNNKPCFKCNQPGHFAKDCTSEITCYNCSKVGHTSKDCPLNNQSFDSDMTCFNCNQVGHSKRNCPEEKVKSDKKMDLECYHCKETGHLSRDCTKEGGIACYNCGSKGHLSRNCTQSDARLCYNCKQPGHESKNCKVADGETSKLLCFKCNEMGHMARSCPNVADNPRTPRGRNGNSFSRGRGGGGNFRSGGGNFNRKFTSAANSIPLGPRKMPGEINKGAE